MSSLDDIIADIQASGSIESVKAIADPDPLCLLVRVPIRHIASRQVEEFTKVINATLEKHGRAAMPIFVLEEGWDMTAVPRASVPPEAKQ